MNKNTNDYLTYYNAGLLVIKDLPNLYNPSKYLFPFRYFPISAYIFTPFSILGFEVGYFVFQIFNFLLNIIIIYLIYKIIQLYSNLNKELNLNYKLENFKDIFIKPENNSILYQSAILIIMLPQFMNYFLGQINTIVSIFILTSVFYFLKEDDMSNFIGGLMLGLGILIKPTLIILIPFILPIYYSKSTKKIDFQFKTTIIRLSGTLILLLISGIYFLASPSLLKGFIEVNFTGNYTTFVGDVDINASFSLTRNLITLFQLIEFNVSNFIIFFITILLFMIPILIYFVLSSNRTNRLIDGYLIGISVILITYYDSWPHYLVILTPFIVLFTLINKNFKYYEIIRFVHHFLAILVVISWGIFYITYEFFPFNLCGLILLLVLYFTLIIFYKQQ
ncbi:MAG: glycosyltransferase 87 family protein [Candidatus Hodarchaeota archaeon]